MMFAQVTFLGSLPRNVSFLLALATKKDVAVAGFNLLLNVFTSCNGFLLFATSCCP